MLPSRLPADVFLQNGVRQPLGRPERSAANTVASHSLSKSGVELSGVDHVRKMLEKLAKEIAKGKLSKKLVKPKKDKMRDTKIHGNTGDVKKEKQRSDFNKPKAGNTVAKLISQQPRTDPIQVSKRNPSTKRSKDFGILKSLLASKENYHKSTTNLLGSAKPKEGPTTVQTGRNGSTSKDKIDKRKLRKVVSQSIATDAKPKIPIKPLAKKDRREQLSMDQFRPKKLTKTQHSFKQSQMSLATDEKLYLNTSSTSMLPRDTEKYPKIPHSPVSGPTNRRFGTNKNLTKQSINEKVATAIQEPSIPTVRLSMSMGHGPPQRQTEFVCRLSDEEKSKWVDDYISTGRQPVLKPKMRVILVDWLSAVSHDLGLVRDTFYLAVAVLDRFLDKHRLESVKELQLLGLVALSLASKMEEVFPPNIGKLLGFCLNAYTVEQYEALELVVCKVGKLLTQTLGWNIRTITLYTWVGVLTSAWDHYLEKVPVLASFLSEQPGCGVFRVPDPKSFKL